MSRAVMHLAMLVPVAAALLVSCRRDTETAAFAPKPKGPVYVHFSCDSIPTISLTDSAGIPSWTIERRKGESVTWIPDANVTIDSIYQKNGQPMPLDSAGAQGRVAGGSFVSTVSNNAQEDTVYLYNLRLRCDPPTGPDVPLIADPEMILR